MRQQYKRDSETFNSMVENAMRNSKHGTVEYAGNKIVW